MANENVDEMMGLWKFTCTEKKRSPREDYFGEAMCRHVIQKRVECAHIHRIVLA